MGRERLFELHPVGAAGGDEGDCLRNVGDEDDLTLIFEHRNAVLVNDRPSAAVGLLQDAVREFKASVGNVSADRVVTGPWHGDAYEVAVGSVIGDLGVWSAWCGAR